MRFRFRLIPFIATVVLVALGLALGQWQDRRAAYKIGLQQAMTTRSNEAPVVLGGQIAPADVMQYRHVEVTGNWLPDWPIYLNNRPYQGRPGFYLLMPLRIADSDTVVLVARGWLPRSMADAAAIAPHQTPKGSVTVDGIAVASVGHIMQLGTPEPLHPGAIVQNVAPQEFAQAAKLKTQPFFIEQAGPSGEGLVRDWPAPSLGVEKHQGYAFQWYALATMALVFFVITGFRSGRKQDN